MPQISLHKILCLITILAFALISTISAQSAEQPQQYSKVIIYFSDKSEVGELADQGVILDHAHYKTTADGFLLETVLNSNELKALAQTRFRHDVIIPDMVQHYNSRPKLTPAQRAEALSKSSVQGLKFGSMGGFYTFAEVVRELDDLARKYPNLITSKQSIGSSSQGRSIWMVKISDNPNRDENEPEIFYNALHHAREPAGMTTVMYLMYYLLENYNTDPDVKSLVDNREFYFVPVVNPDGYVYNQQNNPNGGGYWRKNRNGSGVDLNRNYGKNWGYDNRGSSSRPGSDTYRGTSAFSEPETRALRSFCNGRQFKAVLNYHTYSNLLIYPWGHIPNSETPDKATFQRIARGMTGYNGYRYGTPNQTVGYVGNGGADDWMYAPTSQKGKIISMTPEVGGFSDGFWPSQSRIIPLAEENLQPNLYLARQAGSLFHITQHRITEVSGNGNKQINPGETIQIAFTIENIGLSDAENVTCQLSSQNSNVLISSSSVSAINIPSLQSASTGHFSFIVAKDFPLNDSLSLTLKMKVLDEVQTYVLKKRVIGGVTAISEPSPLAQEYRLEPNYPNPFNPTTTIRYQLKNSTKVKLSIFNLKGEEIRTLVNENQSAGAQQTVWDARDNAGRQVSSGIYIYKLKAGHFVKMHKMLLVK